MPTSLKSVSESPYAVGDIVKSAKGSPGANFVPTDGAVYTQASKSLLYTAIGKIKNPDAAGCIAGTTAPGVAQNNLGIAYGNGMFVTLGHGNQAASSAYFTSTDGVTWTQRAMPASTYWVAIAYGAGKFVAITGGTQTTNSNAAYSTDGLTWTLSSLPTALNWSHVSYVGSLFIATAVGTSTTVIATSPDGITWTGRIMPAARVNAGVAYGAGLYVVPSKGQGSYFTSPDGVTWTQRAFASAYNIASIVYGDKFVAVTSQGQAIVSTDGLTWKQVVLPYFPSNLLAVTYGGGFYAAIGGINSVTTGVMYISQDGIKWNAVALWSVTAWSCVAYGNNSFVSTAGFDITLANNSAVVVPLYSYNTATEFVVPNEPYGYIKFTDVV